MPGAPDWIRPLAALTRAQGGDRAGARRLLSELLGAEHDLHPQRRRARPRAAPGARRHRRTPGPRRALSRRRRVGTRRRGPSLIRAGLLRGVPVDRRRVRRSSSTRRRTACRCRRSRRSSLCRRIGGHVMRRSLLVGLAVVGLMIGSFLNVCIARLPGGRVGRVAARRAVRRAEPPIALVRQRPGGELPGARRTMPRCRADQLCAIRSSRSLTRWAVRGAGRAGSSTSPIAPRAAPRA